MKALKNNAISTITKNLKYDLPAGIVVYLVAVPLCLGIALASGAPPIAGIITGIVGGMVVSLFSGSPLAVSGPAAGLTVIVLGAIQALESYETFLLAVFIAGIMQLAFGFAKTGIMANYFPSPVIKGMLAAIGIILILKQIPHAIGYDVDYIGDFNFLQWDKENTFTELWRAFKSLEFGALIISAISVAVMLLWPVIVPPKMKLIPAPLLVVGIGVGMNIIFAKFMPSFYLYSEHLVEIPVMKNFGELSALLHAPDFSQLSNFKVWTVALTLAIVASLETLLSVNAVDKLDPQKRKSSNNKELKAQGIGNIVAAMLGGLPMTAVIVRGATNVSAGARTGTSAFFHGFLMLVSVLIFPELINMIPLACLAAILLVVGYKLTNISLYRSLFTQGWEQFAPFIITIIAIVWTDLLTGIGIGMAVSALFILRRNILNPYVFQKQEDDNGNKIKLVLSEEVSFLNKAHILDSLERIQPNSDLVIDASKAKHIDIDIIEMVEDFKLTAQEKHINLELIGWNKAHQVYKHKQVHNHLHQDYQKLFENNRNWVKERLQADPEYFEKMAQGQSPKYLFIGCSDSRIPESVIAGTNPGEMFVHRNIANLVIHTDMNLMSVLQYSVDVLKVEHVIVCGHYGCGGVKAAIDSTDQGLIDKWLTNIKDVYRIYYNELEGIKDDLDRHKRLVELNVREQVYHLCMTGTIQGAWAKGERPQVHGWVYDIHEGLLKDLDVDIKRDFKGYKLYEYNAKETLNWHEETDKEPTQKEVRLAEKK